MYSQYTRLSSLIGQRLPRELLFSFSSGLCICHNASEFQKTSRTARTEKKQAARDTQYDWGKALLDCAFASGRWCPMGHKGCPVCTKHKHIHVVDTLILSLIQLANCTTISYRPIDWYIVPSTISALKHMKLRRIFGEDILITHLFFFSIPKY